MASLKRMHVFSLPLVFFLFFFSLQFAQGHRKIHISNKLPSRVLMATQSSSPTFYNAFDSSFQNSGSMYHPNNLNNQNSLDFNDNINKDDHRDFNYKGTFNNKGLVSASLDSTNNNNNAFYPNTYTNNKYDNNENFAASTTSDYKANAGKYSYPTFSAPSTSSQSLYNHKFPTSFEASFPNKESYGKESPSSSGQQGLYSSPTNDQPSFYSSPSSETSLYTSPYNEKSLYTSPSNEQSFYASPSNEQSSSPLNYKASYPFNANDSPSMTKVSQFDEFTKSHPVSNYDSFFNTPTINKNLVHTFPISDHDLTYGQVQVP